MRQTTLPEQTAKLIELGFEKPKNTQYIQRAKARNLHSPFIEFGEHEFEGSYSIGELIELLPRIIYRDYNYYKPSIFSTSQGWHVVYADFGDGFMWIIKHDTYSTELIDAIFEMLIELKEEGVI